ncbi:hypothetical protein EVAR_78256_1 [Eumeta japonica]|uniref:Uncharacterized protein n=1 Tax=Eumeta variegata TaxID=151549 RepID=A0A4C1T2Y5_EUMVA|nr:hypothetical protein EVAR_78256_1 [Eumeta japonica]
MESWLKTGRLTSGKSVSDSSLDPEPPAVCIENISENVPGSSRQTGHTVEVAFASRTPACAGPPTGLGCGACGNRSTGGPRSVAPVLRLPACMSRKLCCLFRRLLNKLKQETLQESVMISKDWDFFAESRSAAYKPKSGSEKRKNKRKIELQTAASNPKQSRLSFTSTSQELEDPQNRSESQPGLSSSSSIFELDEKLDSVSYASNSEQSIAAATLPILITQDTAPQETNACFSNPKDTITSITSSDTGSSANIDNVALKPLTLTVDD